MFPEFFDGARKTDFAAVFSFADNRGNLGVREPAPDAQQHDIALLAGKLLQGGLNGFELERRVGIANNVSIVVQIPGVFEINCGFLGPVVVNDGVSGNLVEPGLKSPGGI